MSPSTGRAAASCLTAKVRYTQTPYARIRNIAPIAHGHINMRGIYDFDLSAPSDGDSGGHEAEKPSATSPEEAKSIR